MYYYFFIAILSSSVIPCPSETLNSLPKPTLESISLAVFISLLYHAPYISLPQTSLLLNISHII